MVLNYQLGILIGIFLTICIEAVGYKIWQQLRPEPVSKESEALRVLQDIIKRRMLYVHHPYFKTTLDKSIRVLKSSELTNEHGRYNHETV